MNPARWLISPPSRLLHRVAGWVACRRGKHDWQRCVSVPVGRMHRAYRWLWTCGRGRCDATRYTYEAVGERE